MRVRARRSSMKQKSGTGYPLIVMRALVLSGGGMFGAWQAGAWSVLAAEFQPDLIVGASVGSLNGYAVACGVTPAMLRELWLREDFASLHRLEASLRILTR